MVGILMIFTSCNQTLTGKATGWYLPEAAHPYYSFVEAGFSVDFASPEGPNPPIDESSIELNKDEESVRFLKDNAVVQKLASAIALKDVDQSKYDAIFYVGGWGPTRDLPTNPASIALAAEFWRSGRIVAAVCHGPAALVNVTDSDGKNIFAGRVATGFSDAEDAKLGYTNDVPFALETRMKELGCKYEKAAELFGVKVCADGKLYTGQNPPSAKALGDEIVKALKA
ncbi:class I glutamine amidotransferase-like protein, partial [Peniophora sp. CONT]